jgi:hypothetical protein
MDKHPLVNQRGVALLLFLIVLIAIAGTFVSNLLGSKVEAVNRSKIVHDYEVLSKAKQALLSYVVDYSLPTHTGGLANMGVLPCPDLRTTSSSGAQDSPCGKLHTNSAGFLPWKTLGIDSLRDSSGECLWYVVSGDYKTGPKARMRNEDSNGLLQVQDENGLLYHGENPDDRPIALIITPGSILQGQSHLPDCQGNSNEASYLESDGRVHHATGVSFNYTTDHADTADKIWTYVYGTASSRLKNSEFNDKMVWITKQEYWDAVKAQNDLDASNTDSPIYRLTERLAQCVADYGNDENNEDRVLPWPAPIDLVEYRNNDNNGDANEYKDYNYGPLLVSSPLGAASPLMGRFPQNITNTEGADEFYDIDRRALITVTPTQFKVNNSTNMLATCLNSAEQALWENWKDRFFYVVSESHQNALTPGPPDSILNNRCNPASVTDCVTINGNEVAAIVFYAGSATATQSRDSTPVDTDQKRLLSNYLETDPNTGSNAHMYPIDIDIGYAGDDPQYHHDIGDLAYCVTVNQISNSYRFGAC